MTIVLDVPVLQEQDTAERREKRIQAAVALFDAELITQGQGAELAGLTRVEFFDELGKRGVTSFQYDWQDEVQQVLALMQNAVPEAQQETAQDAD